MEDPVPASPAAAPTTNWSLIIAAKAPEEQRRAALDRLCRLYWPPLYAYARRHGLMPADAEDATQEFFAKILAQDWLAQVDRNKGRFRGYLFQSMSFHLSETRRHHAAKKRGGGTAHIPIDTALAEERFVRQSGSPADPAASFDHAWACTVLDVALTDLAAEETKAGRGARLEVLKPFLTQAPTPGDYERLADRLGLARPSVAVLVHRLGKRYREIIRAVVADTLVDPADIDRELRHLLQSFGENPTGR
jgi:RNA polymerase sigma-70 factor (ECF subfamily)